MKTQKSITIKLLSFCAAVLILISASACTLNGVPFTNGDGMDIQVTLKEADVNSLLRNSHNRVDHKAGDLLDEISKVDMQEGVLRVYGTRVEKGETISGSYDASLSAVDGALKAKITAVNIPGLSLDDPRVQDINEELSSSLSRSAAENRDHVKFTDVQVGDNSLTIHMNIRWERK